MVIRSLCALGTAQLASCSFCVPTSCEIVGALNPSCRLRRSVNAFLDLSARPPRSPRLVFVTAASPHSPPINQQHPLQDVVIVAATRTPIGAIHGALSAVPGAELGVIAAKAAIQRAGDWNVSAESVACSACMFLIGLKPSDIEDSYIGVVVSSGLGQAPARQVVLGSGLYIAI